MYNMYMRLTLLGGGRNKEGAVKAALEFHLSAQHRSRLQRHLQQKKKNTFSLEFDNQVAKGREANRSAIKVAEC